MTGFGASSLQEGGIACSVELKAVNNRFFKLSLRIPDNYASLEPQIESLLRKTIERGSVNATVKIRKERNGSDFKISETALKSYFEQIQQISRSLKLATSPPLEQLVNLPGVIETATEFGSDDTENVWQLVEKTLSQALETLQTMRKTEGNSMVRDISANIESLRHLVGSVEKLAPKVAPLYRQRLMERIGKIAEEQNFTISESDVIREIALFADRVDISEETVRFRSHLVQFEEAIASKESCGKKLDFLTQELFRETNTMGAKANDADITKNVVEMKTIIERIREMVQNAE
jgi:uncharacterized protein (TIGR00255 family)